jgi:hypothetical protein
MGSHRYVLGYGNPISYVDPDGRIGYLTGLRDSFDETDRILREYAESTPYVGGMIGLARGAMGLASVPTRALNTGSDAVAQALPFDATRGVAEDGAVAFGATVDTTAHVVTHPVETGQAIHANIVDTTSRTFFEGDGAAASDFNSGIVQLAPLPSLAAAVGGASVRVVTSGMANRRVQTGAKVVTESADGGVEARIADDLGQFDQDIPTARGGVTVSHNDTIKLNTSGSIGDQGMPYEDAVGSVPGIGDRLPPNFKTFDYFNDETGVATSVKTLDTSTASRIADPKKVYQSLRRDINKASNFDEYRLMKRSLDSSQIAGRVVRVAVPRSTNSDQWAQIQRAIQHGREVGVEVVVETVETQ